MTKLVPVFCLASLMAAGSLSAQAILATDFSNAEVKSYGNNEVIGAGTDPATQMTARMDVANTAIRVAQDGDKRALEFVGSDNPSGPSGVVKMIPAEIGRQENLRLKGSVVFTPLSVSGTRGVFQIVLNGGQWLTTGSTATAVHISLENKFGLVYVGDGGPLRAVKLDADTRYRIEFWADFSNPQQNTWGFDVFLDEGGPSGAPVFGSGPLNTRAPHIVPGIYVLGCGFGPGTSSDPFVRIHSVKLTNAGAEAPGH